MSQERPLRVAVAGLGDIGRKHAAILAADPRVELVALVDRDERTLAAARADHAVPFGFDAVETLLVAHDVAAVELDALVVCLPTALHAPVACAALERDLHVLCESPVADTLAAAMTIAQAERRSAGGVMFGFLHRHHPQVVAEIAAARAAIGSLLQARLTVVRRDGIPLRPAFRERTLSGGGPVNDLLSHALAVLGDVVGRPPLGFATATAWPPLSEGGEAVEDSAHGLLMFVGQPGPVRCAGVTIETAWRTALPREEPDEQWTIRLVGTDGAVTLHLPVGDLAVQPAYAAEVAAFLARAAGRAPWGDEVAHGLWVQRAVEALYVSMLHEGVPVRAGDALPNVWVELP